MKNFTLLCLLFMIVSGLFSQVVITQSSMPLPGDTFIFKVDLSPTVNFNYEQQNGYWDFSALQQDTMQYACYGITSELSLYSIFPESNLYTYGPGALYGGMGGGSPYSSNFGYLFLRTDDEGFKVTGFRGNFGYGDVNVHLQPHELLMKVPFTYGDSIYQHSFWQIAYNYVPADVDTFYRRHTYKYLVAKGTGTIVTPYGTFSNCLLVKEFAKHIDSVIAKYMNFTLYDTLISKDSTVFVHAWNENKRHHLLKAQINPATGEILNILWLNGEIYGKVNQSENLVNFNVLCSPTSENLYIKLQIDSEQEVNIYFTDVNGSFKKQIINKQKITTLNTVVNISEIKSGIYFCVLETQDIRRIIKVIKL